MHHIAAAEAAHSNSSYSGSEWKFGKKSEEILTLLDELILQQHLKAMAWEEGRGTRCLLLKCGISRSCAAPAGVVRWTNHSGAAAGDHENEGRHQREEQPGRFAPTRRPCSLAGHSIVEDQARWDQWRRLAGGTLVLQAGDRGRGKGERRCKFLLEGEVWRGRQQLHFECNIGRQQSHFTIPLPFNF